MRALITGITGFAGRHLAGLLAGRGWDVHGMVRSPEARSAGALAAIPAGRLALADVTNAAAVADVVRRIEPDAVVHLAGLAFVPDSYADPSAFFRVNVLGAIHLFAAVRRHSPAARVVAVASADAYGLLEPEDLPVVERCRFRPLSPYGASKAALDLVAFQWARGSGLDVVRARPFNHIGPGQRPEFVCPDFARQIAAIERGLHAPQIHVGNLDVVRDFTDVRDVVAAYADLLEHGERGVAYNVCSGVGHSIGELLRELIQLGRRPVEVVVAPERVRKSDVPSVVGSFARLERLSGWKPRHEWRRTLADVLEEWRGRTESP